MEIPFSQGKIQRTKTKAEAEVTNRAALVLLNWKALIHFDTTVLCDFTAYAKENAN
ncbi:MAG: hypothetical protein JWR18_798 [Segetibacter sp.]|jgi:hypothetical protein|nr:hypothetical protein [Segetibacter sp.]